MLNKTLPYLLLLLIVIIPACEVYKQDDYVEQYVVEAFITAGETLPEVRLSRTIPLSQTYVFEAVAISGADIVIRLTGENGSPAAEYTYTESSLRGVYIPDDRDSRILSGRAYTLEVTGLDRPEDRITASTIVPQQFEIVSLNVGETVYQSDIQFEFKLTRSFFPGRQNIFVASSTALDPNNFPLTPFWADRDGKPEEYIQVSSGLINEGNYTVNDDDTIDLRYPWIGIAYYGPNRLTIYAVDDNIFDYYRSLQTQQGGGGTISPGQIENVLWNVEGGIGLFGARAGVSADVVVNSGF
ncbi:MAG: DUF4249 domain-containing protein [Balneolaceae bacterium]|nr:MAG: DUF4249 domain-containing protein [Balneolaceae bacterium]